MNLEQLIEKNKRLVKQIKLQGKINKAKSENRKLREILWENRTIFNIPDELIDRERRIQPTRRRKAIQPKNNRWYEKRNSKISKKKHAQIKSRHWRIKSRVK